MQKKSKKRINKTYHPNNSDRKENGADLSFTNIVKEIDGLKRELVSIRSQKYLHTVAKEKGRKEPSDNFDNGNKVFNEETNPKIKPINNNMYIGEPEEGDFKCRCVDNKMGSPLNKKGGSWLRVQLVPISIKCRETKLKIQIQQNKIRSCMERLQGEENCKKQLLQLMQSEVNSTNMIINKAISDLQEKISDNKSQYKEMKEELSDLSIKVMKMGEKYVNQKHLNEGQVQQIADLKRQLSYYMSLMKDSQNEAHKYSKQYSDLQLYVKELQNSNQLLRKEVTYLENNLKESNRKLQLLSEERDGLEKSLKLKQSDLHLSQVQKAKYKQKRKQVQKQVEKLNKQLFDQNQKLTKKEQDVTKLEQKLKDLEFRLAQFQSKEKQNVRQKTSKKLEIDKLTKQNTILSLTLTEKEDILKNQDEIIVNLKQKYQVQIRTNKKLTENIQVYQLEINELSSQIDELRRANQRYKNQHFKNKLVGYNGESKGTLLGSSEQLQQQKWKINSHSKNRKKILGQIQDLIQKHRRSESSEDQGSSN